MRFLLMPLFLFLWMSSLLAQTECAVELDAELGATGAHWFEAITEVEGATFQWNVNGSSLAEGNDNTLEWYNMLGAPSWEVCVVMETVEGCVAEDCVTPAELVPDCIDEALIDPDMACFELWAPVCGCDGVTYSNSCYATHIGGVTSFEEGECGSDPCLDENLIDPNVPCPAIWDPVCGCDGVTYSNSCEAEHLGGVLAYTQGECGPTVMCDLVIEASPSEVTGVWNFLVYDGSNPLAGPLSADEVEWDGNGEVVGEGPNGSTQVAFWGTNDFLFVACATVWCGNEWVEVCWETANNSQSTEACAPLTIVLNAGWGSADGADTLGLHLVLAMVDADMELDLSLELEGGSVDESWSLFCLPAGHCFELEAELESGDLDDIDVLDIAVVMGQELPAWQNVLEGWSEGEGSWTTTFGVDVTEDCEVEEPDAVPTVSTLPIAAVPNPARGWVQFTGWTEGSAHVVLRNALGQTLATFPKVMPSQPLKLNPSWRGVVFAEICGADWTSRPVLVIR